MAFGLHCHEPVRSELRSPERVEKAMISTSAAPSRFVTTASVLIKPDRPRAIDRFIDYFGEPGADLCGDEMLDEADVRDILDEEGAPR